MKQILDGNGIDVTASTVALLKTNRNLVMADLFHLTMLGGAQSRNQFGFVARWTDRDYPITSNLLNSAPPTANKAWWPPGFTGSGIFFPQRIKRDGITSKVGLESDTVGIEVFTNDSLDSTVQGVGSLVRPAPSLLDNSIPSYRDAFSLSTVDFLTVAQTIKQAAWQGELDGVYIYIFRAVMPADNGDVDTLGIFPLFTGFVKEFQVTRLSVKFQVTSLVDYFTTTYTPTQVITNTDRGGEDVINLPLSGLSSNVQPGSTSLALIGDGGPPPSNVEVDGELHGIPPVGPFVVPVVNAGANFVSDIAVVFSETGIPLVSVGGSPSEGQYHVNATGDYTFNSADAGKGVSISYIWNNPNGGTLANGILIYQYGGQFQRPLDSPLGTQRVIRMIYTNTFLGGLNQIYLFQPLPIPPTPASPGPGDSFQAFQISALDSAQSISGKGFPFIPKPESTL